jgi:hypothetical protein
MSCQYFPLNFTGKYPPAQLDSDLVDFRSFAFSRAVIEIIHPVLTLDVLAAVRPFGPDLLREVSDPLLVVRASDPVLAAFKLCSLRL